MPRAVLSRTLGVCVLFHLSVTVRRLATGNFLLRLGDGDKWDEPHLQEDKQGQSLHPRVPRNTREEKKTQDTRSNSVRRLRGQRVLNKTKKTEN